MGAAILDLSDGAQAHVRSTIHAATTIFNVTLQTHNTMIEALCFVELVTRAFKTTHSKERFSMVQ